MNAFFLNSRSRLKNTAAPGRVFHRAPRRSWRFIDLAYLVVCLSGTLTAVAQQPGPSPANLTDDEAHLLEMVRTDYREGMFERTQQHTRDFLRRFPTSPQRFEVQLTQARAQYFVGAGLYAQALATLNSPTTQVPSKLRPEYVFWQGEILLQMEKWGEAEKKYRELIGLLPEKTLVQSAQIGLAWSLFKQGKEDDARQLLGTLISSQGQDDVGQKASIYLARMLIGKSQLKEAGQLLDSLLAAKPRLGAEMEADYWLGEIAQADNRPADAIAKYSLVTGNPKAYPRSLVAQSWFGEGTCQQKLQQPDQAMLAFEQAFTIGDDERLKLASFKLYLQSAQILQRLPEAETKLRNFAQKDVAPITASAALFAIGSSQAEQNETDQAIGTLEAMLTAYPDSIWRAAANYQLGDLYREKDQLDAAIKAYQTCLDSGADEVTQQQVVFKLGEIYLAQKDTAKAAASFQKAATVGGALAENALFNLILVQANRDDLDGFMVAENQLDQQFPQSSFQARVILEKAQLLERKGQVDKARQTYQDALARNQDPTQRPLFLLRLGDLLYHAGQYEDALKMCTDLVANYPQDAGVPEATYKAIWCNYLLKRLPADQARSALLEIFKKYPQDPQSANALFNAAEFSFNAQDYVGAQTSFEQLAKAFPQSELVDQALFFAGRAAAKHEDYTAALEILEKVKEGSSFKIEAQILQGNIYHQLLKFENAIILFDSVLATEKSGSPYFVETSLSKGRCLFALGSTDSTRYDQASAVFATILNTNQGNLAQRNEAAYTRAKCFEMVNRPTDALALYLDVLNGPVGTTPAPPSGDPAPDVLPPELYWRVQAGESAAELRKKDQDWPGALAIYRKLEQIGGPLQAQFRSDINQLRREHFLYDDES